MINDGLSLNVMPFRICVLMLKKNIPIEEGVE